MTMRTTTIALAIEHRARPDGTTEIVALRGAGSPLSWPIDALPPALAFALVNELAHVGALDDDDGPVLTTDERATVQASARALRADFARDTAIAEELDRGLG